MRILVKALEDDAIPENVVVDYVPGWWGGYYFTGQYMSPVIPMAASGPVVVAHSPAAPTSVEARDRAAAGGAPRSATCRIRLLE